MAQFNKFTEKEKEFIQKNFESMTLRQLAAALDRSEGGVKTWVMKLGLRRNKRFNWTEKSINVLKELYPNYSAKHIADILNTSDYVIYKKADNLKIKKSPEYLAALNKQMGENLQKNGCATRFVKGQKPWCAGKKPGTRGRSGQTQFKKGEKPHNTLKVGDVRKPAGYWKIKIAEPNKWEFLHIYLWRKAHGEVPEGMCISFKDGNTDNCRIENLECLTRGELVNKYGINALPEDLKATIRTFGHLKRVINRRLKNAQEQN